MDHHDRAWWPAADALARLGHAVIVLDPEAADQADLVWEPNHDPPFGVITVVAAPHLTGWQLSIAEELIELDAEALDLIETLDPLVLDEDDGDPS